MHFKIRLVTLRQRWTAKLVATMNDEQSKFVDVPVPVAAEQDEHVLIQESVKTLLVSLNRARLIVGLEFKSTVEEFLFNRGKPVWLTNTLSSRDVHEGVVKDCCVHELLGLKAQSEIGKGWAFALGSFRTDGSGIRIGLERLGVCK